MALQKVKRGGELYFAKNMNLLIPDPLAIQSYFVILGMKEVCKKVVVTIPRTGRFPKVFAFSSFSRYVDKVYYVSNITENWAKTVLQEDNSQQEGNFINSIVNICKKESIDLIYPSSEGYIGVFSKNKRYFNDMGVTIPVPDFPVLINILDKYKVTKIAEEAGVDCPLTYKIEGSRSLKTAAAKIGFPLIVKPRFGSASHGFCKFESQEKLFGSYQNIEKKYGKLLIQEYIPGNEMFYISMGIDESQMPLVSFSTNSRIAGMVVNQGRNPGFIAGDKLPVSEINQSILELIKELKCKGWINLQFKVVPGDRSIKFLELNQRILRGSWMPMEMGLNTPLFMHDAYKKKNPVLKKFYWPKGTFFLSPVQDMLVFIVYMWCLLVKVWYKHILSQSKNPFKKLPSFSEVLKDYKERYSSKHKEFSPFFKYFFNDPLVSVFYWINYLKVLIKEDYPHHFQQ